MDVMPAPARGATVSHPERQDPVQSDRPKRLARQLLAVLPDLPAELQVRDPTANDSAGLLQPPQESPRAPRRATQAKGMGERSKERPRRPHSYPKEPTAPRLPR